MDNPFLSDIIANREDDTPRLVYADWLDERGYPERAEFIRVQCELAKLPPPYKEEKMLDRGVPVTAKGDGYYTILHVDNGTHKPGDRVDVLCHVPLGKPRWRRGLKVVKFINQHDTFHAEMVLRKDDKSGPWTGEALRRREGELWRSMDATQRITFIDLPPTCLATIVPENMSRLSSGWSCLALVRRGFVAELTCTAGAWLGGECGRCGGEKRVVVLDPASPNGETVGHIQCPNCHGKGHITGLHESLAWWPGQTMACPGCKDRTHDTAIRLAMEGLKCHDCSGKGTVPRPCPPTAQPIEVVTITDDATSDQGFYWDSDRHIVKNDRWPTIIFAVPAYVER